MLLEEKNYTLAELSKWFQISSKNLSHYKDKRFRELKQYTDFEVIYTQARRVSSINVTKVKEPNYGVLDLKKQFLEWLPRNISNVATNTEEFGRVLFWPLIINCYCKEYNIPYDGAHYLWVEDEGTSHDNKRKVYGKRKIPNPEYKKWHYLFNLAKQWGSKNNIHLEDYGIDCCVDSFNPTSMRLTTEEDRKKEKKYILNGSVYSIKKY